MKETVPLTETLFHFLLEEKGKRLQTLQTDSHARLHLERSPLGVTVSGVQEAKPEVRLSARELAEYYCAQGDLMAAGASIRRERRRTGGSRQSRRRDTLRRYPFPLHWKGRNICSPWRGGQTA